MSEAVNLDVGEDIEFRVRDGLRLAARRHRARQGNATPLLCLAGLTRNTRDFEPIARYLSHHPEHPRTVYALDARGRGRSERDTNWRNYTVPVEAQDVLDFICREGLHGTAVIGTSRGGLAAMVVAALQPTALGPVVLNDIGPVVERQGLARIAGYVGRTPVPLTWDDARARVREANVAQFPKLTDADWDALARQWFNEAGGRPAAGYDPAIARSFAGTDVPPPLWPQFEALKRKPLLVVRGMLSDLLAADTVAAMSRRHPTMATLVVADQGHAPLLRDTVTMEVISRFLVDAETGQPITGKAYS